MIDAVDLFIFLDDIQLEHDTHTPWQYKNRIKGPNGELWLTIPRIHNGLQLIKDVQINYAKDWPYKHLKSICQSYPWYTGNLLQYLYIHFNTRPRLLADLTIGIIESICIELDIHAKFLRASSLNLTGPKVEHLEKILHTVGATEYLANPGSRTYLEPALPLKEIEVKWFDYQHPTYPQRGNWTPYLSVIDVIMNTGPEEAIKIIRKGSEGL